MNNKVREIFHDAESLYREALKELKEGRIRDASEKAWGATLRATNALILAKTDREIEGAKETTKELHNLVGEDGKMEILVGRFHTRRDFLHGDCFYGGLCEPKDQIERRIRETDKYIADAKKLAEI